ncbi:hypothetical protein [uncultured Modestobacter sp.]|uniref:hypothetical protein n=1 Tax=uncultured Modestobacter sp. TaxID=380048 RepID=UPI0026383CA5|nr:hypothetical protein [uncultured Modestobacter sp.]
MTGVGDILSAPIDLVSLSPHLLATLSGLLAGASATGVVGRIVGFFSARRTHEAERLIAEARIELQARALDRLTASLEAYGPNELRNFEAHRLDSDIAPEIQDWLLSRRFTIANQLQSPPEDGPVYGVAKDGEKT